MVLEKRILRFCDAGRIRVAEGKSKRKLDHDEPKRKAAKASHISDQKARAKQDNPNL